MLQTFFDGPADHRLINRGSDMVVYLRKTGGFQTSSSMSPQLWMIKKHI